MNIESPNIARTGDLKQKSQTQTKNDSDLKFSDELKELKTADKPEVQTQAQTVETQTAKSQNVELQKTEIENTSENIKPEETFNESASESNLTANIQNKFIDKTEPKYQEIIQNEIEPNNIIQPVFEEQKEDTSDKDLVPKPVEELRNELINEFANLTELKKEMAVEQPTIETPIEKAFEQPTIETPMEKAFEQPVQENPIEKIIEQPTIETPVEKITEEHQIEPHEEKIIGNALQNLTSVLHEINRPEDNKQEETIVEQNPFAEKLNQRDDKKASLLKNIKEIDDKKDEGEKLINNDFSIDNKDKLPQMTPNMSFGGDGQPFSSFMNNSEQENGEKKLSSSAKDLAEEAAILSTMAENVAIANKIQSEMTAETPKVKIVTKNDGVKKIDTKTNIVQETIVKYDTVIMNEADVEVFTELVQNGEVNLNNLAPEAAQKAVHVSKTLSDMLAKAMEDNKPVRIEFDNGISVIIKISKDGKISADFLPSTQAAEAYLKENLPILKQKFDDQNIDYDELNHRERRNQDREQNRKKGREDE